MALIFFPIIVYVNAPERSLTFITQAYQFLLVEFGFTVIMFFIWIVCIEWCFEQLSRRFGEEFLIDFKLPAQILLLVVAIAAALAINSAKSQLVFKQLAPRLLPKTQTTQHAVQTNQRNTTAINGIILNAQMKA